MKKNINYDLIGYLVCIGLLAFLVMNLIICLYEGLKK